MARFTEGELEVMRILWEHGPLTPPEIEALFPREIKNSAVRSYLSILVEKKHVSRRRAGKAYVYRARTPKESAFKSMYRQLVETFCGGSSEVLIARLIKAEELSEEELLELKRMASEPDTGEGGRQ